MTAILFSALESVRRPEYTGRNRCLPCTAVNVGIAAVAAGLIATISVPGGAAAFALCAAVIYLRGYLVPGTPTLTKRYVPERVHRLLGTHGDPEAEPGPELGEGTEDGAKAESGTGTGDETEVADLLREAGVVTDCPDADDLCLEPAFRATWRDRIREIREAGDGRERLASILEVDPAELSLEERDDRFWVLFEGDRVDAWPSEAAFLADLAVEPTLAEWDDGWEELEPRERTLTIASLRAFLERCPACESELETAEDTWETCCREGTTASVECPDCGDVVFSGRLE